MPYSYLLITIYCLFFAFITWNNFSRGLFLFFLLLPTYLIRFNIGPLPTTLLEMMLWVIFVVWLIKYHKHIILNLKSSVLNHKLLFISIGLFLLSATISIFTSSNLKSALGEWKAFYIEPVILFFILITNYKLLITKKFINNIIFALILSGIITSILAIFQHFTGWLVPEAFWQNQNTFRVTAWYGFPNAVGLFLAPLVPLAIYLAIENWKQMMKVESIKYKVKSCVLIGVFLLSTFTFILAIIYARSTGALVGLVAGIGFLLLIYKKTRWYTLAVGIIGLISLFSFPGLSSLKNEILLQDRSGQIRVSIWSETIRFLKDNPIFGAGLASYSEKIIPYHTTLNDEGIEIFHHPHNIFLTMYVNLGLLGLISFVLIIVSLFLIPYSLFKNKHNMEHGTWNSLPIYLTTSLIIILIMGLVDSPYIKNDLAIFFWLMPALLINVTQVLRPDVHTA